MVAFGDFLRHNRDSEFTMHYLDYDELKLMIEEGDRAPVLQDRLSPSKSKTHAFGSPQAIAVMQRLEQEVAKVQSLVTERTASAHNRLDMLADVLRQSREVDRSSVEQEADAIGEQLCKLSKFIVLNTTGFRKICKKFDKRCDQTSLTWIAAKLAKEGLSAEKLDNLVIILGNVYASLRAEAKTPWVPPSDFERQTTKYWVRNEDMMSVMCKLVKHINILVMTPKTEDTAAEPRAFNPVSSVYLDSDEMSCYSSRIDRIEGAELFRVRWYGLDPQCCKPIFVERKTHHESWVVEPSIKERFEIDFKEVPSLLAGGAQDKMEDLDGIAAEVKIAIQEQQLKPVVRTVYQRCALQSASSNAVRITLDTNVFFINETGVSSSEWCSPLDRSTRKKDCLQFPYSVLELKLQAPAPAYLEELLASDLLIASPAFSKFLTACAIHAADRVPKLPYWFEERLLDEFVRECKQEEEDPLPGRASLSPRADSQDARVETRTSVAKVHPSGTDGAPARKSRPALLKIEPKTFFANERTFIQWLSASVLLVTLGLGLLATQSDFGNVAGFTVLPVGLLFMIYALWRYHRRTAQILRRDTQGYEDRHGPAALVAALVIACICAASYQLSTMNGNDSLHHSRVEILPSKEFEVILEAGLFSDRIVGLNAIAQTLGATAGVKQPTVASAGKSFARHSLDTPTPHVLQANEASLKLLKSDSDADAGISVSFKKRGIDADILRGASIDCYHLFSAHCSVKIEQSFQLNHNEFHRIAKLGDLPSTVVLPTVGQLRDLFGDAKTINSALGSKSSPLSASTPLIVRSQEYLLRTELAFVLADHPVVGHVDLAYSSPSAVYAAPGAVVQPLAGSKFSFAIEPGQGELFDAELLDAAHLAFAAIQQAPWAAKGG